MSDDDYGGGGGGGGGRPADNTPGKHRGPRFSWTAAYEETFFRSLCESVRDGYREGTIFKTEAWDRAMADLLREHGAQANKGHLINKSDNARKKFRLWRGLREDPAFVYNHNTRMVTADEEAWAQHLQKEPLARSLKGRPFDHEQYYEILFPDVIGSGGAPKRITKPRRKGDSSVGADDQHDPHHHQGPQHHDHNQAGVADILGVSDANYAAMMTPHSMQTHSQQQQQQSSQQQQQQQTHMAAAAATQMHMARASPSLMQTNMMPTQGALSMVVSGQSQMPALPPSTTMLHGGRGTMASTSALTPPEESVSQQQQQRKRLMGGDGATSDKRRRANGAGYHSATSSANTVGVANTSAVTGTAVTDMSVLNSPVPNYPGTSTSGASASWASTPNNSNPNTAMQTADMHVAMLGNITNTASNSTAQPQSHNTNYLYNSLVPCNPAAAAAANASSNAAPTLATLLSDFTKIVAKAQQPPWSERALDIFFADFAAEDLDLQVKIAEKVLTDENKAMVFCKMALPLRRHWVKRLRELHNRTSV